MNHLKVLQKRFWYELPIPVHQLLICCIHAVAITTAHVMLMHSLQKTVCVPSRSINGRVASGMPYVTSTATFSKPHSATNEPDLFG
jgi:hypothetical protein